MQKLCSHVRNLVKSSLFTAFIISGLSSSAMAFDGLEHVIEAKDIIRMQLWHEGIKTADSIAYDDLDVVIKESEHLIEEIAVPLQQLESAHGLTNI